MAKLLICGRAFRAEGPLVPPFLPKEEQHGSYQKAVEDKENPAGSALRSPAETNERQAEALAYRE